MRIERIRTTPVSVPMVPERIISGAAGTHDRSPFLVVEVDTDAGFTGLGEVSCTPGWSGEDSTTARHVIASYIGPAIASLDPRSPEAAWPVIDSAIAGHNFTKAGIEMALWDIAGKAAGLPVHRLLGGPVRSEIPTKFSVTGTEPDHAAEVASWAVDQGYPAMKIKVGRGGVAADISRVAAVRAAIGDDIVLGVDANCGWDRAEAVLAGRHLAALGVSFMEQPVAAHDYTGMAEVRRLVEMPVVADESAGTPEDAARLAVNESCDILSIYVGMAGGIAPARRVASVATSFGLGWTIGSNLELGIAMAAHMHIAAATHGLDRRVPADILSPFYYEGDVITDLLDVRAGTAIPPEGPGLGVELDRDALDRYRDDR